MSITYGVLRGAVINSIPYKSGGDHYQVEIKADQLYRIAIDVYSELAGANLRYSPTGNTTLDTDRLVLYYKDENFIHPLTTEFLKVKTGLTLKANLDPSICLDYIRTAPPLFPINAMQVVAPKTATTPGEDLNDEIGPWVQKAQNNPDAEIFAFGSSWDDNAAGANADTEVYFNPDPKVGMHDIHMNQGDSGSEGKSNGPNQDGALFFHFISTNQWVAMFFRFQSQSIETDSNGNPIAKK